jgi:hypothetical protein
MPRLFGLNRKTILWWYAASGFVSAVGTTIAAWRFDNPRTTLIGLLVTLIVAPLLLAEFPRR